MKEVFRNELHSQPAYKAVSRPQETERLTTDLTSQASRRRWRKLAARIVSLSPSMPCLHSANLSGNDGGSCRGGGVGGSSEPAGDLLEEHIGRAVSVNFEKAARAAVEPAYFCSAPQDVVTGPTQIGTTTPTFGNLP